MAKTDRVRTGIHGLDPLIEGGIPRGFSVLITGYAGTGKTVMTLQMLTHMALSGERCLYLTFEETDKKLIDQAREFEWNVEKAIKEKTLDIHPMKKYDEDIPSIIGFLEAEVKKGLTVVAFDSLTMLTGLGHLYKSKISKEITLLAGERDFIPSGHEIRQEHIRYLIKSVDSLGLTSLWIAEAHPSKEFVATLTTDGASEYQCDGVIYLEKMPDGSRKLYIEKMRLTKTEDKPYSMYFIEEGIGVNPIGVRT